jgi:hypothetical protein
MVGSKGEEKPESIDPQHLSAVLEGLAQARRWEFASDEEIEAALSRFDRRRRARYGGRED